ncbi:hypothetical protein [Erwinia sp. QL-Z3]|uniref:hypothetical protein n=1 Tax=Erwinia sp. QL-Z3 TaxID=2547962 RepID=UPI0010710A9F|nr:hypothetical protein [Erwinia sp. QL-Z3]QBR52286.1 hypothetical protein E2F51_20955 [Erwinia sp. QL-Z3]
MTTQDLLILTAVVMAILFSVSFAIRRPGISESDRRVAEVESMTSECRQILKGVIGYIDALIVTLESRCPPVTSQGLVNAAELQHWLKRVDESPVKLSDEQIGRCEFLLSEHFPDEWLAWQIHILSLQLDVTTFFLTPEPGRAMESLAAGRTVNEIRAFTESLRKQRQLLDAYQQHLRDSLAEEVGLSGRVMQASGRQVI